MNHTIRLPVSADTATVNGSHFKADSYIWQTLDFSSARVRETNRLLDALAGPNSPPDYHLEVPQREGDDEIWVVHRVRPRWEVGDLLTRRRYRTLSEPGGRIEAVTAERCGNGWEWVFVLQPLPTPAELRGCDRNFTGGQESVAYVREGRGKL